MFHRKKINSDLLLLALLVVHLRLDSEVANYNRWNSVPQSREIFLGPSSAYTQIDFHAPYSNYRHFHPKSLEYSDADEAEILFNRLNYFSSVRNRRNHLITCYASSPGIHDAQATATENANSVTGDNRADPPRSVDAVRPPESASEVATNRDASMTTQDLSPEDRDLIEILWKQDIDLGVTREAYDPHQNSDIEKLKDAEITKETVLQEFLAHEELKGYENNPIINDPWAGLNYTIDSETGENLILDELTSLNDSDIPSSELLDDDDVLGALSQDSFLPFDENAALPNLTNAFSNSNFPDDLSCDFLISQIEDLEKELAQCETLSESPLINQDVQNEMYPTMEDHWQDVTTILPLSVLGNHQGSFAPLLPHPSYMYHSFANGNNYPLSSASHSGTSESFSRTLLQNTTMDSSMLNQQNTYQRIPSNSSPSNVGFAVAESIATLSNDTEPVPSNGPVNSIFGSDVPELMCTNQTAAAPHNDFSLSEFLLDDELQLLEVPEPSFANRNIQGEDNMDTSNDSFTLTSGRTPSFSDCHEWIDSCSESSSLQNERDNVARNKHSSLTSVSETNFAFYQNSEKFNYEAMSKRQKHFDQKYRENGSKGYKTAFDHDSNTNQHYAFPRNQFGDAFDRSSCAVDRNGSTDKFDLGISKVPNSRCTDFLRHNHTYHLPFESSNSLQKPVTRDKYKPTPEEDGVNKDEKLAKELSLPISIDDIINLAIEDFNERLSKYELTEPQLTLIRDIRRRGKNKVAAQNCRKRKMDQICTLQQDIDMLQNERFQLESEQRHLLHQRHFLQDKYTRLYQLVLQHANMEPPDLPNYLPLLFKTERASNSDNLMSDDDCDQNKGNKNKRKTKK